jgi:DNA (cytosine-5)-methyltransferase 3A
MRVLSLFDGMACGMLAFKSVGIEVESYDAYEIDKYAIKAATHNFPSIRENGDVFTADFTRYKGVDFVVGGSPCTYWSIAQKNNRETEASGMGWELFSQYLRAIKEAEPKYFIYENNYSMSAAIRESINKAFGFEAVFINSALVSAQTRKRLYWVGKRNADGTYSKVDVKQPTDRGILLRDILESTNVGIGVGYRNRREDDGKLYRRYETHGEEKANCLTTVRTDSMVAEPIYVGEIPEHNGTYRNGKQPSQQYRIYSEDGKAVAVTTCAITNVAQPIRVGTMPRSDGTLIDHQQSRVYSIDGKSTNLNANGGGQGAKTGLYAIPVGKSKEATVYEVKDGVITIKGKQYPIKLADGYYIIRKLTVTECKRLQTVPEWYDFPVSDAQAYKMLGNGWTVEVIAHLIKAALTNQTAKAEVAQMTIFDLV